MPKGPRGEKRPSSPVSSMVRAMEVATGIREEEYGDDDGGVDDARVAKRVGRPRPPRDDSDDPEKYEIAALEMPDPPPKPKKKKGRKKKRKET